jgi:multisubunit Na+/H+ antiporter MnhG subunit
MSVHHPITEAILLAIVVLAAWLGVIGALRMKQPTQSLHYLSLPAIGAIALTIAVFVETGPSQASFKTLAIAFMLLAVNSVVTHATARAFRTREIGHWQPRDGDNIAGVPGELVRRGGIEFVRDTKEFES